MKTLAQIIKEDKKIQAHIFRSYHPISKETKVGRKKELDADNFRFSGMVDNAFKNFGTVRERQAKR